MLAYKNIIKKYKDLTLKSYSFEILEGEILGLYNDFNSSAEKLMELLAGIRVKDSGEVLYNDKPLKDLTNKVAYLASSPMIYEELKVKDLFLLHAKYQKISHQKLNQFINRCNNLFFLSKIYHAKIESLNSEVKMMIYVLIVLLYSPSYIFWSNPFAFFSTELVQKILHFAKVELGDSLSFVLCSNDVKQLNACCSKVFEVKDGELLKDFMS